MRRAVAHVVGAGASGLAVAVRVALEGSRDVVVHESADEPGGKRRPVWDDSSGQALDSSFVVPPGAGATLAFLDLIDAKARWRPFAAGGIEFVDLASGERRIVRAGLERSPLWLFSAAKRPPDMKASDVIRFRRALRKPGQATVEALLGDFGASFQRYWRPLCLAALNTEPKRASARLFAAAAAAAFSGKGLPLHPKLGFARDYIEPTVRALQRAGGRLRCGRDLIGLGFSAGRVARLEFEDDAVDLPEGDILVLATPPQVNARLVPKCSAPHDFYSSVSAHFEVDSDASAREAIGIVGGFGSWILQSEGRVDVLVQDAGDLALAPREIVALRLWAETAGIVGAPDAMPAWRIDARPDEGFAATPEEDARRPPAKTAWRNLILAGAYTAGDWADTLDGALRSAEIAARLAAAA